MIYTRKKVSTELEKDMIIGLIIDTRFCREILPILKPELLQVDQFKIILSWVRDYFSKHEKAPKEDIEKIYISQRLKLDTALGDNIESFLRELSKKCENLESFNTDFYANRSVLYIKERNLRVLNDKISGLLETGAVEEAEALVANYRKAARTTSEWESAYSEKDVEQILFEEEEFLLELPGEVGRLIGKMHRTDLVAILGPMKRGKTQWLGEMSQMAAEDYLKVAFFSLEMQKKQIKRRKYKRLMARDYEKEEIVIPIFDCVHNQKGTCNLPIRESNSSGIPIDDMGLPPAFNESYGHEPCSVCRKLKNGNFIPGIWYIKENRPKINYPDLVEAIRSFKRVYGDNIKIISHPINTANIGSIKRDLDLLEYTEGFVPDVIIIDYADILGPEDSRLTGRDSINETWKMLKNLAQDRNALVITATQSSRGSMDRRRVKATDTSEDIRKLAHVNIMITLNQTPMDKRRGLMRVGVAVGREIDFDELKEIMVTQNLSIGQPFLDSEAPVYFDPNEGESENEEQN